MQTCIESKIGASMGHVQVHTASPICVSEDSGEGVHHLLGTVVWHALAPMSQPSCAALFLHLASSNIRRVRLILSV